VVTVDETGTASVKAVKALPVPGVQKPPRQVGKRFRDCRVAAPEKKKVKRPAGLRKRPAWLRQDHLGASPAVCRGDAGCQAWCPQPCKLKAADSDHLVPRPDSDDGAGAAAQNRIGAVVEQLKGWNQAASTDPDEGGGEQLGWQLAGQLGARIVPTTVQCTMQRVQPDRGHHCESKQNKRYDSTGLLSDK
jgi:hypothetical protein